MTAVHYAHSVTRAIWLIFDDIAKSVILALHALGHKGVQSVLFGDIVKSVIFAQRGSSRFGGSKNQPPASFITDSGPLQKFSRVNSNS